MYTMEYVEIINTVFYLIIYHAGFVSPFSILNK